MSEGARMISVDKSFLFVHVPKTGGNSIQSVLLAHAEDTMRCDRPWQDGVERFGLLNRRLGTVKHSRLDDYHRALPREEFDRVFKFSCVRNPWDRAISFYFSPHRGAREWDRKRFLRLLRDLRPMTSFLSLSPRRGALTVLELRLLRRPGRGARFPAQGVTGNVDFLMRFETLQEDYRSLCRQIGIEHTPLPLRNRSVRSHYSEYYDQELIEVVATRFAEDIEVFGYRDQAPEPSSAPIGIRTVAGRR